MPAFTKMNAWKQIVQTMVANVRCLHSCSKMIKAWQLRAQESLANMVWDYELDKLLEDDELWVIDSGAAYHVVKKKNLLDKPIPLLSKNNVQGFCGEINSRLTYIGHASLPVVSLNKPAATKKAFRLRKVYYNQHTTDNILSVSTLTRDFPKLSFEFYPTEFLLKNVKTKKVLAKGFQMRGLYFWPDPKIDALNTKYEKSNSWEIWMAIPAIIIMVLWRMSFCRVKRKLVLVMHKVRTCAPFSHIFRRNEKKSQHKFTDSWIVDSGCGGHSTFDQTLLRNSNAVDNNNRVAIDAFGRMIATTHSGEVSLPSHKFGREILVHDVDLIPDSVVNLLSVSEMTSEFYSCIKLGSEGSVMKSLRTNEVMAKGRKRNGYYQWENY